jgi:hypothetical protein
MPTYDWKPFLEKWSSEIIASRQFASFLKYCAEFYPGSYTQEVLESGWLGYEGATVEQIAQAEARLGIKLPPSYREFLKVTNGWRIMIRFIPRMWSTEEVEWLSKTDRELAEGWLSYVPASDEEYFVYGKEQKEFSLKGEYFLTALDISDKELAGTARYLLNPKVVFENGEWEAWFYAHWLPGARRYRSFWEMMQDEYKTFLYLESQKEPERSPKKSISNLVKWIFSKRSGS